MTFVLLDSLSQLTIYYRRNFWEPFKVVSYNDPGNKNYDCGQNQCYSRGPPNKQFLDNDTVIENHFYGNLSYTFIWNATNAPTTIIFLSSRVCHPHRNTGNQRQYPTE